MDLLDDDMGRWFLIFYYTLSGLLRTDIEFSMIFLLIGYNVSCISRVQTKEAFCDHAVLLAVLLRTFLTNLAYPPDR